MTTEYTSILGWTAIETAVEALSVSLPVTTPFLHGRKVLGEIRTSLRSSLSLLRRSNARTGSSGTFHEINSSAKGLNLEQSEWKITAVAIHKAPDGIPSRSILVTDDLKVR
ncbi:MAG: hypothetical protein MMC33_001550 [Icmadophila ericetorum]|nr:hypothetical protein [Icmadophila ericetorum]